MDVVQSVLARLKGTIQIETARGRGTTFRMRLPLTLAIIRALMFRVEQRLYALPLNAVAEIARTVEENIHQVEHYDVLQLRDDLLPLLRLGAAPKSGPERARRKAFVLVIKNGERKFGLVVDALEGEGELVIKALDDQSDYHRPGQRRIDSGRWPGGSHPQHGGVDGAFYSRTRRCEWAKNDGSALQPRIFKHQHNRDGCRPSSRHGRGPIMKKPVRVLVVDDSALMRKLIPKILEADASIEVVGTAMDGNFGLKKIGDLSPDVITLDLEMPGLNGIDTLKEIMRRWRLPVIVVSSHSTEGASITLKALALGAFDFVSKPQGCGREHAGNCEAVDQENPCRRAERGCATAISPQRNARGTAEQASAGGAHAHYRDRRFHRRPERFAISVF